jgi:flagellar biogenesis protein FliO
MDWLNNLINGENGSAINLVLITLALAVLLIVVVWIFRKMTGTAARRAMRSRVPRLSITDSTTVDEKRYLVMVRRDNIEHLLLIGGANDLVVESNIVRAQTPQKQGAASVAQSTQPTTSSVEEEIAEQEQHSSVAPIAAATAVGAAGMATAASLTSSVTETTTEAITDAGEAITETSGDIAETASDTLTEVVETVPDITSSLVEQPSEIPETTLETVSVDIEPEVEAVEFEPESVVSEIGSSVETQVATQAAEFIEEPVHIAEESAIEVEVPKIDLESTISAQLDNALSTEALDIGTDEVSTVVTENEPSLEPQQESVLDSDGDDEMQRLLNELSNEAKEPAQ